MKSTHMAIAAAAILATLPVAAQTQSKTTLAIFGAGTLAAPFRAIDEAFMKLHPEVDIQAQFGGSVKMVKQVSELGEVADVVAVADYRVIPKFLFGTGGKTRYADWYAGFATNAVTFVYTPQSKFASEITADNWYEILSRPGVQIGRSNPDTDPSGYQTVQALKLAENYYGRPGLAKAILANSPKTNMRDTETELIAALQSGQIDYLAIYLSDARQHHFSYLDLPPQTNLSDAKYAGLYAKASVQTANGTVTGVPTVYAVTVPNNASQPAMARAYVAFLLGPEGRAAMAAAGFGTLAPAIADDRTRLPADLQALTVPWPAR